MYKLNKIIEAELEKEKAQDDLRDRLKNLKAMKMITYKAAAKELNVNNSVISRWVHGKKGMTDEHLIQINEFIVTHEAAASLEEGENDQ